MRGSSQEKHVARNFHCRTGELHDRLDSVEKRESERRFSRFSFSFESPLRRVNVIPPCAPRPNTS